ncbi:alpha/beta fold hydrolase [Blastococcus goldschmidtiae]|uniref:Alpha/beta hydrolase n=1 Tax=Blastococcus goldschmidtiae TaxID=3075546 RepID=A0ABU2K6T2_9ACTN|nr:alpha/beta hydrolase [Blastococcus sp. DSM 46792]MDT0275895.1 alpha/beta hydrolase [Blastococcus sp. DSM 46792]
MRKGRTAAAVGTALVAGAVARRVRARGLASRMSGSGPAVHTDDGVRLHVEVHGPADAPVTVLFSHGFATRSAVYDQQWTALRGRARLVRYDQRGHGASGWAGVRSAGVDRLGRDLEQVVDELAGDTPVVVVGHSMGGMAVLALAGRRPELFGTRITGVALLSTRAAPLPGTGSSSGGQDRVRAGLAAAGAWLLWLVAPAIGAVQPFRSRPGRRLLRRQLFTEAASEDDVRTMSRWWTETPTGVLTAYLTSLVTYDQRPAIDALRAVPVLVLAGTADRTIPPDSAPRLARQLGERARLVLVDGAGHMVNVTHAATVDAALDDLLSRSQPEHSSR